MTSPSTPKPSDMPGAQPQPEPNPQLQHPIPTTPPPPQAPQQQPAQQQPEQPQQPNTTQQQPPSPPSTSSVPPEKWQEIARKWENRALGKSGEPEWDDRVVKASKWEEAEAARRTKEENQAIEIQQANERAVRAETALRAERIARETGVLPDVLGSGTEDEMRAVAARLLEWKGPGTPPEPPKPSTSAVPASTVTSSDQLGHSPNQLPQLTREQFTALPVDQRMAAVRAGQCVNIGIGKPKEQRRMGNQLELGAHATQVTQ